MGGSIHDESLLLTTISTTKANFDEQHSEHITLVNSPPVAATTSWATLHFKAALQI
jgi:hypothetical protein